MGLILNQGLVTEYTFPSSFSMDEPPWSKRLAEMERAYKHGSVITGDEMVQARPLRIWGTLFHPTRAAFSTALDAMTAICYRKDLTFHSTPHYSDRFLYLDSVANFSLDYLVTLMAADIEILFRITDPFWYSDTQNSNAQVGLGSGNLVAFSNLGQIEISPVIDVVTATGTVTSVTLLNNSDNNRTFTYTRNMTVGRGFRVKAAEGGVWYWNGSAHSEDITNFSGTFYRLQPGINQITLTLTGGGTVDITHFWRIKWLG